MIKRLFPLIALSFAFTLHAAEQPEFVWATSAGGVHHDKTRAVNVDSKGNVLLTGEFNGPAKFGNAEISGAGSMDFFVTKCDPTGKILWTRAGGGSGIDRGYAVVADMAGNVFAAGHYQSKDADFSGTAAPLRGEYDFFVAKYDPDGNLVWLRTGGGEGYDYAHGLAIDPEGNVIVTGAVAGNATFGDVVVEKGPGSRLFCAKYSNSGTLLWANTTTGKASGAGHGVATDGAGNIYIGGLNRGVGQFGSQELNTASGQDSLVAKLDPKGAVLWVALAHGDTSCLVHEITCDKQGRVWVAGMFKNHATFGAETFASGGEKDSDAFIAHYATDGSFKWARAGKGPATDYGLGVANDGLGQSFLCGIFSENFLLGGGSLASKGSSDIYVAAFDEGGSLQWLTQAGGKGGDNAYSMVHDGRGHLVIGGAFSGVATFGSIELHDTGGSDLYAAKLKVPASGAPKAK